MEVPADVKVEVLEENPTSLRFLIPMTPLAIAQDLSEEELEAIAASEIYRTTVISQAYYS
ncbi:hypothetical protein [Nostoc sp.]|uniref:hypothetical protein n=1 Tax=Nostoc sp. TaxID=1180 RepID=UPI002FF99A63